MENKLKSYIEAEQLFDLEQDRILLAVSAGVDSVVLAQLFANLSLKFGIAHCNFGLRGEESDGDFAFVRDLAAKLEVPFFENHFDTLSFAKKNQLSIQVAARELRYEWFENIRQANDFQYIATAHHLDDSVETLFMHLLKGCGIRGLQGIRASNKEKKLVRPLGFASKTEILAYAKNNNIKYREDSSNASDKYFRNQLRHQLMPMIAEFQPQWTTIFKDNFNRLQQAERVYDWAVSHWLQLACRQENDCLHIDIEALKKSPSCNTLLLELLQPYFFNIQQIDELLKNEQAGAYTDSSTHRLLRDRNEWLLSPLHHWQSAEKFFSIDISQQTSGFLQLPTLGLSYQIIEPASDFQPQKSAHIFYLDADKLASPLRLRLWKNGDRFQPSGMDGKSKKVSDFFKDKKMGLYEKTMTWLVESDGQIALLLGHRNDERFKISQQSKRILELRISAYNV